MKEKERLKNFPWLDQTKESWQLNVMCEPRLDQGPEKVFLLEQLVKIQ